MFEIQAKEKRKCISSEVRFYSIQDMMEMSGWSEMIVQKLFNDPSFPATNFGRKKLVECHALIDYFSERRDKETEPYWM